MAKKAVKNAATSTVNPSDEKASAHPHFFSLEGRLDSELIFVIEKGETGPYEGRAGQLLQKMIAAMGVRHTDVLMISAQPSPDTGADAQAEFQSLLQGSASRAKVGIALGDAAAAFVQKMAPSGETKISWITSFHPSRLLAEPALKKEAWEHLKLAAKSLGWKLPPRGA